MSYSKDLANKLASLSIEMHAIIDTAKADGNRGLTSSEAEKFDKLEADYTGIEASIARAEKAESRTEFLAKAKPDNIADVQADMFAAKTEDPRYASTFRKYLAFGHEGLEQDERKVLNAKFQSNTGSRILSAASTTTPSQGGYVVPTGFSGQLETALKFYGGIYG